MRIFIYSRKSVSTGKGESIENQVELCRQYIQDHIDGGRDADLVVYEDEGFSGKNLDRPQFQQMLADAKLQKPDYVVCYRLDRISRSVGDFAPLVEDLMARGIGFVSIREQFDTSTPMGRAMMYIASVFAQLERETIAQRVRDNMLLLARSGRWLGGTPPTGFTSQRVEEVVMDGKRRSLCELRAEPAEMETVRLIYRSYLELQSLNGVAKRLIRMGIRGRGGKPYSLPGVRDILSNPVYCMADQDAWDYFSGLGADLGFPRDQCSPPNGLLAYNRRDRSHPGNPHTDPSQWVIAAGRHQGVVSGSDWVKIQRLLAEKKPGLPLRPPQSFNNYSLLSGQIFCSKCGARMFAKRRSNSDARFDYICGGKLRDGTLCDCQNLGGQHADDLVFRYLLDRVQADAGIFPLLEGLRTRLAAQAPPDPGPRLAAQIQRRRQELDGLITALALAADQEALARHVGARVEALDRELRELLVQKEEAAGPPPGPDRDEEGLERLSGELSDPRALLCRLPIRERREWVRLFVDHLEWDGAQLHLFLYQRGDSKLFSPAQPPR